MYTLQVFFGDTPKPSETHRVGRAAEVLTRIPQLLAAHEGCERIVVSVDDVCLFAVDCQGNNLG